MSDNCFLELGLYIWSWPWLTSKRWWMNFIAMGISSTPLSKKSPGNEIQDGGLENDYVFSCSIAKDSSSMSIVSQQVEWKREFSEIPHQIVRDSWRPRNSVRWRKDNKEHTGAKLLPAVVLVYHRGKGQHTGRKHYRQICHRETCRTEMRPELSWSRGYTKYWCLKNALCFSTGSGEWRQEPSWGGHTP